jgi:hypothetical protein
VIPLRTVLYGILPAVLRRLVPLVVVSLVGLVGCDSPQSKSLATGPEVSTSLQSRWWAWAAAEPTGTNPVVDRTGEFCARNQPRDLWFLAGTFDGEVSRRCVLPGDRPIVLPVVNLYSDSSRDCADFMRSAGGELTLDGQTLPVERIDGESLVFNVAGRNVFEMAAGTVHVTGCGLWARIPTLSPGPHRLTLRGQSGDFMTRVNYTLDVVESVTSPS